MFPLECPRRVKAKGSVRGARRRFACGGDARRVRRRHTRQRRGQREWQPDHDQHLQPLDDGRRRFERRGEHDRTGRQAGRSGPTHLQSLRRPPGSDRAQAGQGPAQADGRHLQGPVRTAVHRAQAAGTRLFDLRQLGARRSRSSGRESLRQGSAEAVRPDQEPAVPQGSRLQEVPGQLGPDRLRSAAARQARHALAEDPAEGQQGRRQEAQPAGNQVLLRTAQVAVRPARTPQHPDHPDQDSGTGRKGQERNRIGQELCQRRQVGLDRPGQQGRRRLPARCRQGARAEGARRSGLQSSS